MTETPPTDPEPATEPVVAPAAQPAVVVPPPAENKPSRLMQALAWVGIAAGSVFIVAVVFGTGFFLGAHSDGGGHHHRGGHDRGGMMMFHHGGPGGGPGQMGPRHGMMPPWGPGGPGGPGSGPERPETPATPAPPARP